jgi:hypothetical protein
MKMVRLLTAAAVMAACAGSALGQVETGGKALVPNPPGYAADGAAALPPGYAGAGDATTSPGKGADVPMAAQMRDVQAQAREAAAKAKEANARIMDQTRKLQSDLQARQGGLTTRTMSLYGTLGSAREKPALVLTQPLDAKTRGEWEEDLEVMGKLVRDAVGKAGGAPEAMGIPLTTARGQMSAMYLQGSGVLVMTSVNWPLAGGQKPAAAEVVEQPLSPWEQAKGELAGKPVNKGVAPGLVLTGMEPFNGEKVAALQKQIVEVLVQGKHFRHLAADEWVTVTVVGPSEAGGQVRLTVKAQKSDMDAADDKAGTEAFARKVKALLE